MCVFLGYTFDLDSIVEDGNDDGYEVQALALQLSVFLSVSVCLSIYYSIYISISIYL